MTATVPQRVRVAGDLFHGRVPAGAVYVGRAAPGLPASPYANPHRVGHCRRCGAWHNEAGAVDAYAHHFTQRPDLMAAACADLAGRDLACWCHPDVPCHADVLLPVANQEPTMPDVHAPQPQHINRGFHPFPAQLPPGPPPVTELADGLVDLARLALAFGRIDRIAVYHPDQVTPESDTDHTVMLVWAACAIAATWFPGQLDVGLVAQYAAVHDAPEVYAGDTPTLRITDEGRAAKAAREAAAVDRLAAEFTHRLPWFAYTLRNYEDQRFPEARFVRGVDKIMPKLVHLLDRCAGLLEQGISRGELADAFARQHHDMASYVGEFQAVLDVRDELVRRVLERPELADDGPESDPSFREHGNHHAPTAGGAWWPDLAEAAPNGGRDTTRGEGR